MAIKRAYSIADIEKRKFTMLELQGEWHRHLGTMERNGSVLVMGDSGDGKTTYAMQMSKEFCKLERVHYNSAEEGVRFTFKRSLKLNNMKSVASRFQYAKENYDELFLRLNRKRQPRIIIIDSVQYFFLGKKVKDYFKLIETFNDTLFVFLSHINKGMPTGAVAKKIYWDCQNRILVKDFKACVDKSRCGADEVVPYVISQKKADERELKLARNG